MRNLNANEVKRFVIDTNMNLNGVGFSDYDVEDNSLKLIKNMKGN